MTDRPYIEEIPVDVLRYRGPLSPSEAVAWYLCEDPDGPGLSKPAAGEVMAVDPRNVWTFVRRAREKLDTETD